MEYRRLGKSGLPLSVLSLGSWLTFGSQLNDEVAEKLMITAYEAGVNFFDNAEIYAHGRSEKVMGKLLKKLTWRRDSYCVSSKVFFGSGELPTQKGLHRKHVAEACEQAMKRLNVDYLDLYFCHRPDPETPIEETVWAMHQLIQQGKIFYWGTSEWSAEQITEAHTIAKKHHLIAPTMEQPQYNLLHRERFETEYAPLYKKYRMGTTIWSPLASGFLTGKYIDHTPRKSRIGNKEWLRKQKLENEVQMKKVQQLKAVADELDVSLTRMSLAWCLKNPNVSTIILGASGVKQLKENLSSLEVVGMMTKEVMGKIEEIIKSEVP